MQVFFILAVKVFDDSELEFHTVNGSLTMSMGPIWNGHSEVLHGIKILYCYQQAFVLLSQLKTWSMANDKHGNITNINGNLKTSKV